LGPGAVPRAKARGLRTVYERFMPQFDWVCWFFLWGNLTISGSIANVIVVERAAAEGVRISFRDYLRIGLPVTAATLAMGAAWLWWTS
jgi:hypothetical protein